MQASDEAAIGTTTPPRQLAFYQIWNMCIGLFGVQIVWGLHNVNTSRIFQTLGAEISELPILWIAAPLSGLLVQPIIGYLSDRTWTPMGRRRPYLLAGAILAGLSLFAMPNATTLAAGALILWLLTASINMAMEPFRALVADSLPEEQRTKGYTLQVFFIGSGAVFASALPWIMTHWFGIQNAADDTGLPASVRMAYYVGGAVLVCVVLWTVVTTPEEPRPIPADSERTRDRKATGDTHRATRRGLFWCLGGGMVAAVAFALSLERDVYLLAGAAVLFGLTLFGLDWRRHHGSGSLGLFQIAEDIVRMPAVIRRLAIVQFFTWFGLFAMWIYTIPAVAARHFGTTDALSGAYGEAADWAGILFAAYNAVAAVGALLLPAVSARRGRRMTHTLCLAIGAASFTGFLVIDDPVLLLLPALGIGIAWASILSLPYAIVASAAPPHKTGVYLGIHNIFLVLPQLVAATILGPLVAHLFAGQAILALAVTAGCFAIAAAASFTLPDADAA